MAIKPRSRVWQPLESHLFFDSRRCVITYIFTDKDPFFLTIVVFDIGPLYYIFWKDLKSEKKKSQGRLFP